MIVRRGAMLVSLGAGIPGRFSKPTCLENEIKVG